MIYFKLKGDDFTCKIKDINPVEASAKGFDSISKIALKIADLKNDNLTDESYFKIMKSYGEKISETDKSEVKEIYENANKDLQDDTLPLFMLFDALANLASMASRDDDDDDAFAPIVFSVKKKTIDEDSIDDNDDEDVEYDL